MAELVPDDHDPQSEGHYIELRLDFYPQEGKVDDEGNSEYTLGQVQVHSHHVPDPLYVRALLILAREHVARSMAKNMFREDVPEAVREMASKMMSTKFLMDQMQDPGFLEAEPIRFEIPDDASSLIEGDA